MDFAIFQAAQTAEGGADPEAAVLRFAQHRDRLELIAAVRLGADRIESGAIEPKETGPRADPDIAVACLQGNVHAIGGKTILTEPRIVSVLVDRLPGIQGKRRRGPDSACQKDQNRKKGPCCSHTQHTMECSDVQCVLNVPIGFLAA